MIISIYAEKELKKCNDPKNKKTTTSFSKLGMTGLP